MHPNPTKESLQIQLPENISDTVVEVVLYDALGKQLHQDIYNVQNNKVIVLLNEIPSISKGLIIVKVKTSRGKFSTKVLKE